jgi:uncharacterized SAM-binding protein YcdF (DUF218 family)
MRAIIVLGATLTPQGGPSRPLIRRAGYAAKAARAFPDSPLFCSGAARPGQSSEAEVLAEVLAAAGVDRTRLVLDQDSRDTLQTAVAAARFQRRQGLQRLVVCTEGYHMPRVRMLLSMLGAASEPACDPGRPADAPAAYWRRMLIREAAAFPYDLAVVRWRRRELMAQVEAP